LAHHFRLRRVQWLAETSTEARLYVHRTGAQLLSLSNRDENKVFGITFRTPVADSTGVAHILEHAVLCGSRKYPVKEPFVELLKGSLQTFLNAFTYPDRTAYPVASQNLRDFYNLVDVYLDAVFHPRLTPQVLQQEGWHYEWADGTGRLSYAGVVYNEMKGARSDPEDRLSDCVRQSLFPENTYRHDSGGDPRCIPALDFAAFADFHARFYRPAHARIWFYGDDDPERRLDLLEPYLEELEAAPVDSRIWPQPLQAEPRRVEHAYAASDAAAAGALVTVNWLLPDGQAATERFALRVLEHVLLGTPGSPLRRALIESGLGEDLTGGGLEMELVQPYFSIGLKGVAPERAEAVERLVLETLERVAAEGVPASMWLAAANTLEFGLRENNPGSAPRGLVLMLRAMSFWLYGRDPFEALTFAAAVRQTRVRLERGEGYLEALLRRCFLDNQHRTTVILRPDSSLEDRLRQEEAAALQRARDSMDAAAIDAVRAAQAQLQARQSAPDRPEDLARIPSLSRQDLPREIRRVDTEAVALDGVACRFNDLATDGIVYLDLALDLGALPDELLPLVGLYGRALLEMGTAREDYVALGQRIGTHTGGIHAHQLVTPVRAASAPATWLLIRAKALAGQSEPLTAILGDVLLLGRLDLRERFRQIVLEEKAQAEMGLIPEGSRYVAARLGAHYTAAGGIAEQLGGVSYLFFLRRLLSAIDSAWPEVEARLQQVRQALVARRSAVVNVTAGPAERAALEPHLRALLQQLPNTPGQPAPRQLERLSGDEMLVAPAQVNFVGKATDLAALGYRHTGSASVVVRYLATTWLWEQVRVQGGAYGAFCSLDPLTGLLQFTSYRDPRLLETLTAFDGCSAYLRRLDLTDAELTRAIIGAVGDMDAYRLPDARGYGALIRHLTNVTDAYRQEIRDAVLNTGVQDFRALGQLLEPAAAAGRVVILGSAESAAQVEAVRPGWLAPTRVL
jgi:presequence protease